MIQGTDWSNVYRIVHLTNGARAINIPQSQEINITPQITKEKFTLPLAKYPKLYSELYKSGFKIIGAEFYVHAMEADGLYPPGWRPFHKIQNEVWPVSVCEEIWGNLANAAFKKDDFYFLELARRIQFQITSCIWELKSISEAYGRELNTICRLGEYKNGKKFETQNSLFIYMSAHAFFSNIGTLRDYLAEYIAAFLLKESIPDKRITKMGSLVSELRKLGNKNNPIISEILTASDHDNKDGWLAKMSDYRDLVLHYAPIAYASHRAFLTQKSLFVGEREMPGIFFPLPPNPLELRQKRSKGSLHENVKDWLNYSAKYTPLDDAKDTLDYCHDVLFRICLFPAQLFEYSPYKPEVAKFTSKDLRGPVVTTYYQSDA